MSETRLTSFNFLVAVNLSGFGGEEGVAQRAQGAFSEVLGLELTLEPMTFREGGYHAGPRQLVGKTTVVPLVLKRGVSLDAAFWTWIQRCMNGTYPLPYVTGAVHVRQPQFSASSREAVWQFTNGIVTKVKSADLNAIEARNVPVEELHIVHEGLARRNA
jgi:phage tail-like protein